ncbi:MAG: hypothetical protein ACYSO4_00155 [Planctomycetota bacterium]|jgi:hypothetical protein
MNRFFVWMMVFCGCLFLGACGAPFAGDWQGSGADSMGNEFNFAAKVVDQGDDQYRVLILDALDTQNDPLHVMDGVLEKNEYIYTADDGIYTGAGTLDSDTFEGYYKGPVDGTYVMQRVDGND